ncbi:MAG: FAD-dependent oxidoreductase [Gemmatimonadetes bacterium]|nr:FAD-dependent oxidoreductase [Gemmatimonadota bacterium]
MRVAIVGSGVSGLVAAHLLHPRHDITVFEARDRIGGHVNTIPVETEGGAWHVDTGFIVYNEANYPNFTRLLKKLSVGTQPSDMSFSVRCDRTGLEYNGSTLRQLFVQKRNLIRPGYYRMIRDILRFNAEAPGAIANGSAGMSMAEYLEHGKYSSRLADHYLVPMASALWSMPRGKVLEMPAEFFVRFFDNHGMLEVDNRPKWRVVEGGSASYLGPLVAPFKERIRSSTPVQSIRRHNDEVTVNGERFDEVILACHADQALGMLADPSASEREILGALPFQENQVVLHTDTNVLPHRQKAWGAWNYHIRREEHEPVTVTYDMNILQSLAAPETFCVTLNPPEWIDPSRILYETTFDHPVFTAAGTLAQARRGEISGVNRTHYCGAYWGFGFHEDGVRSAVDVGRTFRAEL